MSTHPNLYRQRRKSSTSSTSLFYQSSDRSNSSNAGSNESNNEDLNNHPFNRRRQQEESEAMAFQKHMEQVRSLQMSYYTTSTSFMDNPKQPACQLQASTGRLLQLPLWRDAQWHVPGRSNVLEITDPVYTNMFESILYKPQPWCFGHLYLEEAQPQSGVASSAAPPLSSAEQPLFTWKNAPTSLDPVPAVDTAKTNAAASSPSSPAVLGCLMHIADYRRMADGRLLLLVHAMERFVVTDIVRQLPYSIVNAQILPDTEEIDPLLLDELHPDMLESELQEARAMAVQESVQYHAYEYDPHHSFSEASSSLARHSRLAGDMNSSNFALPPLPPHQQLHVEESPLSPADIAKVLPFCPFAKIPLDEAKSRSRKAAAATTSDDDYTSDSSTDNPPMTTNADEPSLEYRLLHRGILKVPPSDPDFTATSSHSMTIEELEHELWLAMNYFLVTTKLPVSPVLLSLLPPLQNSQQEWPQDFLLHKVAYDLAQLESMEHDFVPVSPEYPAYRRQRRLSFSAAYLLEDYYNTKWGDFKEGQSLKKLLLSIPSTKQRLRVVLERFLQWQQQTWGEFQ